MLDAAVTLIAEDNADDAFLLQQALQKAQFTGPTHVVNDGAAVINYLSGSGKYADRKAYPLPHFAFLDIELVGKSGLEALAWMRQQAAFKNTPVMMITLSGLEKHLKCAHELGASSYVVKPASVDHLAQEFKRFYMHWWPIANASRQGNGNQA